MEDSTGQYLSEIGAVPLLTKDDEVSLAKRIERGQKAKAKLDAGESRSRLRNQFRDGEKAKDHFVRANLRLVVSVAKKYPLPTGMELLDLIQEGNIGLEHAVDKFDWRKGFKFSTYATFWIRQAIGRALDQKANMIRLPGDQAARLRAAIRQDSKGVRELDTEHALLLQLSNTTSLNMVVGEDQAELIDFQYDDMSETPEELVISFDQTRTLNEMLNTLTGRSRFAIEMRFGLIDGKTYNYNTISEILGVSVESIRRSVTRSLEHIKEQAEHVGMNAA